CGLRLSRARQRCLRLRRPDGAPVKTWILPCGVLAAAVLSLLMIGASSSQLELSRVAGIHALLALSVGLSYGQAGILSLSQASFAAVGAYASAIVTTQYGWSPWLGLPLAIAVAALLAYV